MVSHHNLNPIFNPETLKHYTNKSKLSYIYYGHLLWNCMKKIKESPCIREFWTQQFTWLPSERVVLRMRSKGVPMCGQSIIQSFLGLHVRFCQFVSLHLQTFLKSMNYIPPLSCATSCSSKTNWGLHDRFSAHTFKEEQNFWTFITSLFLVLSDFPVVIQYFYPFS